MTQVIIIQNQKESLTRKTVLNPKMSNMVPRIVKPLILSLITGGVDSACFKLGDAFPIQEEDIDSVFYDATEDYPTEEIFIPTANESRSPVSEQSCTCPEQQVYSSDMF
jgi:hypothetical protein